MGTSALDKERLGRMHDVLAGHVERGELPGLVSLVARDGEVHARENTLIHRARWCTSAVRPLR